MATTRPAVKFTCNDYQTAPADTRYELLDGDLLMVPAPNLKHQEAGATTRFGPGNFPDSKSSSTTSSRSDETGSRALQFVWLQELMRMEWWTRRGSNP